MNYYTYAYLREDKTPYYIGKGIGNRIYKRRKTDIKPPKDKSRIIFLKQNLTEEEAFRHEKYMISVFGRIDLGTGILRNRTDGGEGTSNHGTPEQRSEAARKRQASMTPEQRSEAVRKGRANMTPEQRSASARKGNANKTPEQRSEASRKGNANKTPEQRSAGARKANANRTPEQQREAGRKAFSQKFQCTETGFISNAGNLAQYQRAKGIDKSNRVRLDQ